MRTDMYKLWKKEEYTYPVVSGFIPNFVTYIHDEDEVIRPAFLVIPGGGYCTVSNSEGELVAKKFYEKGYNCFVITYTTCMPGPEPLKFQAMKDLSKAIMMIRKYEEKFRIDPEKVTICGFSAGGHLCGSLAVHYDEPKIRFGGEYEGISNRPDAVVLCYPVITSGEHAHKGSFTALLGADATEEELEYMSLEKHVKETTPSIFLWHTATDEAVPVENSYLFAKACKKAGILYEHHVFHKGKHGLSLADEDWASGNYGGEYSMQQWEECITYCIENGITPPAPFEGMGQLPKGTDVVKYFREAMRHYTEKKPERCVRIWPGLVDCWLKDIYE